jgi:hypothetical protein
MAVLGKPNTKCPHGVFKAGEPIARYCTFCNPAFARGVGGSEEPIEEVETEEPEVLDAAEFMAQEMGQRLQVVA